MKGHFFIFLALTLTLFPFVIGSEFGEGCIPTPPDSCNATAYLKCNIAGPTGFTCGCDTEIAVENPDVIETCILIPTELGQSCQVLDGDFDMCNKIPGAKCIGDVCTCIPDVYFQAGITCYKYTEYLYGDCIVGLVGQCDRIEELQGAECISSICTCKPASHVPNLSNNKCLEYRKNIGDPCEPTFGNLNLCGQILGGGVICAANSTCSCDTANQFFLHPDGSRCLKFAEALNDTCEVGTDMCGHIGNAVCSLVFEVSRCICDIDYTTDIVEKKCVPFILNVGESCSPQTNPEQCSRIEGAECYLNNTCQCDSSHFLMNSKCQALPTLPYEPCLINEHCAGVEHTICIGSRCTCDPYNGWDISDDGTCIKLAENVNDNCTTQQGCRNVLGTQCINSACQCLPNYVESATGRLCLIAVDKLAASCLETSQCLMGIGSNSICLVSTGCTCEKGYVGEIVDGGKDRCTIAIGSINSTCEVSTPCVASLGPEGGCINGKCGCNLNAGYINNHCARKVSLHENCTIDDECFVGTNTNAKCDTNTCQCIPGKEEINGVCFGDPRVGDECADDAECSQSINGTVGCVSGICRCTLFSSPSINLLTCAGGNFNSCNVFIISMLIILTNVSKWEH